MKRLFYAIICLSLLAVSCDKDILKEPSITGYKVAGISDLSMGKGSASAVLRIDLDVDNPTRIAYAIDSLSAIVYNEKSAKFADAVLKEPVVAAAKTTGTIPVYLNVTFDKPLSLMSSSLLNGSSFNMDGYTVDLDTQIAAGKISKRIRKDGISIAELIKIIETAKSIKEKIK